jgi:hypothetical protein
MRGMERFSAPEQGSTSILRFRAGAFPSQSDAYWVEVSPGFDGQSAEAEGSHQG